MLIKEIRLQNLLSFGPDTPALELRPLNVLIGPNGSGKSNLIEAISLLRAAPDDLLQPIHDGGGIGEWLWKGNGSKEASLEVLVDTFMQRPSGNTIRHRVTIRSEANRAYLQTEQMERIEPISGAATLVFEGGDREGTFLGEVGSEPVQWTDIERNRSVVALRRDPKKFPLVTQLGDAYRSIRLYLNWDTARSASLRRYQALNQTDQYLKEDFSNLALVLNRLRNDVVTKERLLAKLDYVLPGVTDIGTNIVGAFAQTTLQEGRASIPASRLSDGTLRFLCLAAILLDDSPPPLLCIEEPELGLHPDAVIAIADMLKEAATRTQLIVTTHSDMLLDALSDEPEDVVVFERCDAPIPTSSMTRLSKADLNVWLEKYGLGHLWRRGQIGGNRW